MSAATMKRNGLAWPATFANAVSRAATTAPIPARKLFRVMFMGTLRLLGTYDTTNSPF